MAEGAWGPWGPIYNSLVSGDLGVQQQLADVQVRQQQALALQQQTASNAALMKAMQNVGQEPTPPPGTAPQDMGIMGQIQTQIAGLQKQSNFLDTLANTPGVTVDRRMQLMNESMAVKKTIAAESANLLKERADLYGKLGNIAGAITPQSTQGDVDLAAAQMNRLDPQTLATLPVDRDPRSGQIMLTDKTVKAFQSFGMGAMTQNDRLARQQAAQKQQDLEQQRIEHNAQLAKDEEGRNERAAQARAGVEESRANRLDMHQDVVSQRVYSQAERISNDYKTDDQVKQFADHKKMLTFAVNYVLDPNGNVKPEGAPGTPEWANHDSASDFELSKQFIAMTHPNYRGTTYDAKELRSMANLPEHLANMIAGVAAGKVLAQSDRVNMLNAMKNTLANENDAQIQREDNALKKVNGLTAGIKVDVPLNPDIYVTKYAVRPNTQSTTPEAAPGVTTTSGPQGKAASADPNPEGKTNPKPAPGAYRVQQNGVWGWAVPK